MGVSVFIQVNVSDMWFRIPAYICMVATRSRYMQYLGNLVCCDPPGNELNNYDYWFL